MDACDVIALVTGTPGAGKTYYAMRKVAESLAAGKCVVTNVDLRNDAGRYVADHNFFSRLIPKRRATLADRYQRSLYVSGSIRELFNIRLAGKGEGRGVMILDESQGWMNARNWSDGDRADIVAFFSEHRKKGFDVFLITQDAKNIDRQVRALAEYEITLKNLRRWKFLGIPVAPVNLFLAVWRWSGMAKSIAKRETYVLGWQKDLYDTMQTIHSVDVHALDFDGVTLPLPPLAEQIDGDPIDHLHAQYLAGELTLDQFIYQSDAHTSDPQHLPIGENTV